MREDVWTSCSRHGGHDGKRAARATDSVYVEQSNETITPASRVNPLSVINGSYRHREEPSHYGLRVTIRRRSADVGVSRKTLA